MSLPALHGPAPWFVAATRQNPAFHFHVLAGRAIVLSFLGSAGTAAARQVLSDLALQRDHFDDQRQIFFGVTLDPQDWDSDRAQDDLPGVRFFFDLDGAVSQLYGVGTRSRYRQTTFIIDSGLRILAALPLGDGQGHVAEILRLLDSLPPPGPLAPARPQAPVLIVPRLFEPDFCRALIALYEDQGGRESGFMRDVGGKTVTVFDYQHKRRHDVTITDAEVIRQIRTRLHQRLVPEIHKAFAFDATRMERYLVACYDSGTGGYFRPHRDNTTKGTAHRRFACTINLNAEDYEGGDLRFPEYGPEHYRPPTGGGLIFSCSILHEALPVTRGTRYAFLPFFYDEAAARIRTENHQFLSGEVLDQNAPAG